MYRIFLFLFVIVGITPVFSGELSIPQPKIDERAELLGIVFRLAGVQNFQSDTYKEYSEAINQHFASFKDHPVIHTVRSSLPRHPFTMSEVVLLSIENGRVLFPDEHTERASEHTRSRWALMGVPEFVKQLDDFYVESRFHEFYTVQREIYQQAEEKIKAINDKIDYSWFERFYGSANLEHFYIIPNLSLDKMAYGAFRPLKGGGEEFFAILSAIDPNAVYAEENVATAILHEFNHSFCNPLVKKHLNALKPAAERILSCLDEETTVKKFYPTSTAMLCEYMVRAGVIRYFLEAGQMGVANSQIISAKGIGFIWMEELVEWLGYYENERDKYPTLNDFMPEMAKRQNALVTEEYIAELKKQKENRLKILDEDRPQISVTNPPNGVKDVDPSITAISVSFDRPMMSSMSWSSQDGGKTLPEWSNAEILPIWSEDKQTCTAQVILKPGRTYNIWLNTERFERFRCTDGVPLKPVLYTFTTKGDE